MERHVEISEVLDDLSSERISIPYTESIIGRWRELKSKIESITGLTGLDLVRSIWPQENEMDNEIRLIAENIAVNVSEPSNIYEALFQAIIQPELPDSNSDIIRVMSYHKSKGLTASCVIVAGCMAGAMPTIDIKSSQAQQDEQYEEQCRLFYVTITRATETLVISSSTHVKLSDAKQNGICILGTVPTSSGDYYAVTSASPFLGELGRDAPNQLNGDEWRKIINI